MILISFPLLWRKIDCRDLTWTIISLDRHHSVPLQLGLYEGLSTEALGAALDHGGKGSSIFAHLPLDQLLESHRPPVTPSMEDLMLFVDEADDFYQEERVAIDLRGEFVSLRRLSASGVLASLNQTTAPNLIHLSLERTSSASSMRAQTLLDLLRGCPQLETVLINIFSASRGELRPYTPVALPKPRSIEPGHGEVPIGLVTSLCSPPTVAVGFRGILIVRQSWPYKSIKHVLTAVGIESVILAHIRHKPDLGYKGGDTCSRDPRIVVVEKRGRNPFDADGLLLSHSPQLDDAKTLYIMRLPRQQRHLAGNIGRQARPRFNRLYRSQRIFEFVDPQRRCTPFVPSPSKTSRACYRKENLWIW